ncbi:GyrI-like domain-containing protein [uncultured Aquimarina sp.]|uniref:GyrI-like domain-containing protein n=1 Tax=uncultured Aquimarina sp. TaxID=575652 RepID=UPI002620B951|nr:GyrI-like domain-containing protein [uncultured Aquimarina sp.]
MSSVKHEWRKSEKRMYLPKTNPEKIQIPEYKFVTIEGEGNPNSDFFAEYIGVLYAMAYAIKMNLKKEKTKPKGYFDYTVYPLEGVWDLNKEAKKAYNGTFDKDDLVFKLMIRQPNFINETFFEQMRNQVKEKKPHKLLRNIKFEKITDGECVQIMHIGSYDNEPESFRLMEAYAKKENLTRLSRTHREIYLSDFRKVAPEKLKTVLRFKVKSNTSSIDTKR